MSKINELQAKIDVIRERLGKIDNPQSQQLLEKRLQELNAEFHVWKNYIKGEK